MQNTNIYKIIKKYTSIQKNKIKQIYSISVDNSKMYEDEKVICCKESRYKNLAKYKNKNKYK